jgi:hypothetical protein
MISVPSVQAKRRDHGWRSAVNSFKHTFDRIILDVEQAIIGFGPNDEIARWKPERLTVCSHCDGRWESNAGYQLGIQFA